MSGAYQLFADLAPAVEAALHDSIDRFGVLVPVAKDQHGNILDGHQRARLADELGLKYPTNIIEVADEDEAHEIARTLNEDRRPMPKEQRLPVVVQMAESGLSAPLIAETLHVSHQQVQRDLAGCTYVQPDRVVGKDGKTYPSRREPKPPPDDSLRFAREVKTERREERDQQRIEQRAAVLETAHPLDGERYRVFAHDLRDGPPDIATPALVLTDPPYAADYLPLYSNLDMAAERLLPTGGCLLAMSGQSHLGEVFGRMTRLRYQWTLGYFTPGQSTQVFGRHIKSNWKPVLWYVKGPYSGEHVRDTFSSDGKDKRFHKWGQPVSGMAALIERFTVPGDLVYDPFCGGGATGVAALLAGRLFVGSDIDEACVKQTAARCAAVSS